MVSKIWIINAVLFGIVLFVGMENYEIWSRKEEFSSPSVERVEEKIDYPVRQMSSNLQKRGAYEVVATANPFSKERTEFIPEETVTSEEAEPEVEPVKTLGNKVFLFGVVIMDGYKKALISNPDRRRGEPQTLIVQENDVVMDITIKTIEEERLLVLSKGELYEVNLYDESKPQRKVASSKSSEKPQVVTVVSGDTESAKEQGKPSVPKPSGAPSGQGDKSSGDAAENEPKFINTPFGKMKIKQ